MTSPIVWALAVFGAAGVIAALTVDRLSDRVSSRGTETAAVSTNRINLDPNAGRATVRLPANARGHYYADMGVEGRILRMVVDTGASIVALRASDARAAGLTPGPGSRDYTLSTANGMVEAKGVRIREMRLGSIIVRDVDAVIMTDEQLSTNLLGMTFLSRLRGFEVAGGELILRE
jgi:aspartyl protease family protein